MSYWNHRIVKKVWDNGEITYTIHETHYNSDGTIYGITKNPVYPQGSKQSELLDELKMMKKAFEKPILEWENIVFTPYKGEEDDMP